MKKLFTCFYLFTLIYPLTGQITQNLLAEWEVSNGNHEHTGRDELSLSIKDAENSVFVAASVERDSSFADIFIQKISATGAPLWQFKYSSGLELDYDRPVKMLTAPNNDLYILGRTTYATNQGIGYILKLDAGGGLEWVLNMADETIAHHFYNFFDAYLDENGLLQVTYTCRADDLSTNPIFFSPAPTFFMTVDPAGSVIHSFQKTGIGQPTQSFAYGVNEYSDPAGNFVFIMRDEEIFNKYYLRKIHPVTGADTILPVSEALLSEAEKETLHYIDWEFIKLNDQGDIFAASNSAFGPVDKFFFARLNADGVVQYAWGSSAFVPFAGFQDFFPLDTSVVLTGLYGPDFQYSTFLWNISDSGQMLDSKTLSYNGDLIPQRLIPQDSFFFMHAISQAGHNAYVYKLADNLDIFWTHRLNTPAGYDLGGIDVLETDSQHVVATGTLGAKKHANSLFVSEKDIFVEQFTPGNPGYDWQFVYTDEGTSYVQTIRHAVLKNGNIAVVTAEKAGPEASFSGGSTAAPSYYYIYQYDPAGNFLTKTQSPVQVNIFHYYDIVQSDGAGNMYVPCLRDFNSNMILKVNEQGIPVDSVVVSGGIGRFMVSDDGRVCVVSDVITLTDANFGVAQTFPLDGYATHIFQIPGQEDIYLVGVNNDSVMYQVAPHITLYKNGQFYWRYTLPTPVFQSEYVIYTTNDPVTGRIYLESYSATENSNRLHLINLNGANQFVTPFGDTFAGTFHFIGNDKFYQYRQGRLILFDTLLNVLLEHELPASAYAVSVKGDFLYAFETGSVNIFDKDGNYRFKFFHPELTFNDSDNLLSSNRELYITRTQGNRFASGNPFNFGWQWHRGVLKKFDLAPLLSATESAGISSNPVISCYPNPVSSTLYVKIPEAFQGRNAQINVMDMKGILLHSIQVQRAPSIVAIECAKMPAGTYALQLLGKNGVQSQLFQKY
jgi:hypothetical protein